MEDRDHPGIRGEVRILNMAVSTDRTRARGVLQGSSGEWGWAQGQEGLQNAGMLEYLFLRWE